ncbi:cadherin-related family member 5, partial [Electrophorus electricus]|uniref:cadherin-related family member 5 n=1 Tax=Electrophorus electricus TaxID=8005 RepID=UPI0015D05023
MDLKHLRFSLKTVFCLLAVFSSNTFGQNLCSVKENTFFIKENNIIGTEITSITTEEGVTLAITVNPEEAFGLNGNLLVVVKVLDFEALKEPSLAVSIQCRRDGGTPITLTLFVFVDNINDNPPVFKQSHYDLEVNELSAIDTSIGKIEAIDLDQNRLYYILQSPKDEFMLRSDINPEILTQKVLYYDTTPEVNLILFAQDTPLIVPESPSHTASATIKVTVVDINNRPPWFQPCTETNINSATVCLNFGYQGTVNLTEQATGVLPLEPAPLYAIDGDKGRNDPIRYKIFGGNTDGIFNINSETGSIIMEKPVGVAGPIILSVMAFEMLNPDQFATTSVTLKVVRKSLHPPQFVQPSYEGFISEDANMGSLVLESKTTNNPLQVQATDADFTNGINPDITFEVPKDSGFRITPEGFVLTTGAVSTGSVELQIRVIDTTNDESSTASLSVEITPGISTTMDMHTTVITNATISTDMATTPAITTNITANTPIATDMATDGLPVLVSGGFSVEEMVALGASLAVVVSLCLVVIGLLAHHLRRHRTNWRKMSEASVFRSMLSGGSVGPKDGMQYTNQGFQSDGDAGSISSQKAAELDLPLGPKQSCRELEEQAAPGGTVALQSRSAEPSSTPQPDSSSLTASDHTDGEKEVKPILTKERRVEDGYKAVWFREDIDPNVKEEVVIIPDSEEQDIRHEDDEDDEDEDE